jgi:hypothetical protein
MGEHNSPAYAQGREHKEARNLARSSCPPIDLDTWDPSDWNGYTIMYGRGWNSIEAVPLHSCKRCKPERAP